MFEVPDVLEPVFNTRCELVGWLEPGLNVFDASLDWVGYIVDGHAWSVRTGRWAGPVCGSICLDKMGRTVAWNPGTTVTDKEPPFEPPRPARPPRPQRPQRQARPPRPERPAVSSWSSLKFEEWIGIVRDRWR